MIRTRRGLGYAFVALLLVIAALLSLVGSRSLVKTELASGPLLFLLLVALAAYSSRRRVPVITPPRPASWLLFHNIVGTVTVVLFLVHTRMRIPNGRLEVTLATLYLLIIASGVVGVLVSRRIVRRAPGSEEGISESFPARRRRMREEADALIQKVVEKTGSTTLANFFVSELVPFFDGPRNLWSHFLNSRRPRLRLLRELANITGDGSEEEKETGSELASLIRQKDDLDDLTALRIAVKGWLFVHVPLTYLMLLLAIVHGVVARSYWRGL